MRSKGSGAINQPTDPLWWAPLFGLTIPSIRNEFFKPDFASSYTFLQPMYSLRFAAALATALCASPIISASLASPAPLTPVETGTPWDCDLRTWVRAPNLAPNMRATGDARYVANGTDCADIVKWDVGLVYKERSIVRLR